MKFYKSYRIKLFISIQVKLNWKLASSVSRSAHDPDNIIFGSQDILTLKLHRAALVVINVYKTSLKVPLCLSTMQKEVKIQICVYCGQNICTSLRITCNVRISCRKSAFMSYRSLETYYVEVQIQFVHSSVGKVILSSSSFCSWNVLGKSVPFFFYDCFGNPTLK